MSLSDTYETRALQWLLDPLSSPTRSSATYIGLYTVAPTDAGGGTECSGTSYARQSVSMGVSGNLATNSGAVEFPVAGSSWGTIVAAGIFDALSGGNLIAYGNLTTAKTIDTGDVLRIPTGDFDVTLD